MNNQLHNSISIYLTNAESIQNINQSSNENDNNHQKLENQREIFFNHSSLYIRICIISLSILFIVIGFVYRNACTLKHNVPIFLIIFGILIFLNCLIYNILGATFIVCKTLNCFFFSKFFYIKIIIVLRHARSCSLDKHFRILFASLLGIIFGLMIFIWWFLGTVCYLFDFNE